MQKFLLIRDTLQESWGMLGKFISLPIKRIILSLNSVIFAIFTDLQELHIAMIVTIVYKDSIIIVLGLGLVWEKETIVISSRFC